MKKIVGIIAALALAGSVFADPDITPVQTQFDGNAELQWIADLDAETTGMKNSESATFKIKFINEGTKTTPSTDGLWGELTVKGATVEGTSGTNFAVSAASVEAAKIHFVDGDMYFNMDIRKPGFAVGKIGWTRALYNGGDKGWSNASFGDIGGGYKYVSGYTDDEEEIMYNTGMKDADGKDIKVGTGVKAKKGTKTATEADYQGFTLNFGLPIVDLTFALGDNGQQKAADKEFAWKAAATLKPVDGLSFYVGATGCTADEYKEKTAVAVALGYSYAINEQFSLKPAVQFAMLGKQMDLSAALFFGWGADSGQYKSAFLQFDNAKSLNVADNDWRTTDGLSLMFVKNLKNAAGQDAKTSELAIEAYDAKFLGDYGVTWALAYRAKGADDTFIKNGALSFGAIYNTNFDIIHFTAKVSTGVDLSQQDDKFGIKYGLNVGTKEVVANTDLYVDYVGSLCKFAPDKGCKPDANGLKAGTVTLGAKISF